MNWYLPSIDEMKDLYAGFCGLSVYPGVEGDARTVYKVFRDKFNASLVRYGGYILVNYYWSSSEVEGYSNRVWTQIFSNGEQNSGFIKTGNYSYIRVRCVRSF